MTWSDAARAAALEARRRHAPSKMHQELLRKAIRSWEGSPNTMRIHMQALAEKGRLRRNDAARAAALKWELEHNATTNPAALYRGGGAKTMSSWSENRRVAERFAKLGGTRVTVAPKGTALGLRLSKYAAPGFPREKEWIVTHFTKTRFAGRKK